jgi:hypothetical protein
MTDAAVLMPVFVQVALTFVLLIWMGSRRIRTLRERALRVSDIALGERNWPTPVLQVQNSFHNQFELPLLFYVLIGLALATHHVAAPLVVLSWLFVIARLVHAFIHTSSNRVPARFWAYVFGMTILIAMWLWFAASVIA